VRSRLQSAPDTYPPMPDPILLEIDPADYGWPGSPVDDSDVMDVLKLARLAKEAASKLADRHLALAIETVLDDLAPALRRMEHY
jgi:hypothetical protein